MGDSAAPELRELIVGEDDAGARLDRYLAATLPQYSRAFLRRQINAGGVTLDGESAKASARLRTGQRIRVKISDLPREGPEPEEIPLDILYEDDQIAAINKPPGMVVHPARGHWAGTLASAVAFHFEHLSSAGGPARPGIVHRLDRDTSGVIVIAKTDAAHLHLATQFEARQVEKEYFAIVAGVPDRDRDEVRQSIGSHPYHREKMAIRHNHSSVRDAHTYFEVVERYRGFSTLRAKPLTGRTHQIRVHLAHVGCPVLCDRLYGGRATITRGEITGQDDRDVVLARHALHARRLQFEHPTTKAPLVIEAPLAEDIAEVADLLAKTHNL